MRTPREEAAHWFAHLQNVADDDYTERNRFERWLASSPANAEAYRSIARTWDDFNTHAGLQSMRRAGQQVRAARETRRLMLKRGALGAIAAASVGTLSWQYLRPANPPIWQAEWSTGAGVVQHHTLPDGSTLALGPTSHVLVSYSGSQRQVRLLAGVAAFHVQPDARHPFVVDSHAARITVVGTQFVVDQLNDRVRISVAQGAVRAARRESWLFGLSQRDAQSWLLHADDVLDITARNGTRPIGQRALDAFSWQQGSLVFQNASLAEVAAQLSRYTPVPVQALAEPDATPARIAAVVQVSDIDRFLDRLPRIAAVSIERTPDAIRILPRH